MNYHAGDFILRIKNAYQARKKQVSMPYSNINNAIAHVLIKEGFLASVKESEIEGKRVLVADLRYENRRPSILDIKLISKPSLRVYIDIDGLKKDKDKSLTSILSTSNGILTGKEAIKKGIGGELLFKVW
jgi:small subunit ribosomal protein S8